MAELLVAVEGLDGAGKTTQVALLVSALSTSHPVQEVSFPRYETFFGQEIRGLLDGVHGVSAQTVDPRSMALWYALDRAQWAGTRTGAPDGVVLLNRYSLSNAVYQAARAPDDPELFDWILRLEHRELGLPEPDVTVVLDVSPMVSKRRVADRGDQEGDVYERSSPLLARVRAGYLAAARRLPHVVVVECLDPTGAQRPPAEIHADVLSALRPWIKA
jgi:dTMP kinase